MSEFSNRMSAQRILLKSVNGRDRYKEELFGLSSKAIERWAFENQIDSDSQLLRLIREAGTKLFFLANKSQDQVSEDYKMTFKDVALLSKAIEAQLEAKD